MDAHRGSNIKCYDRIKLTHLHTGQRLHSNEFDCKAGTYNQAVSVHKIRDETDWFIVVHATTPNISHHFQYGDLIVLNNAVAHKFIQLSTEFESPISKHHEISLANSSDKHSLHDQWTLQFVEKTIDQYWRVGDLIKFKHKKSQSYLCSHKKKIKENDDFQVYGENLAKITQKDEKDLDTDGKIKPSIWVVSEIQPFIYSAPITTVKVIKKSQELQNLDKLKKTLDKLPRRTTKKIDHVQELLKNENKRLEQIQDEHKKMNEEYNKFSFWKKYICCCLYHKDDYIKIK